MAIITFRKARLYIKDGGVGTAQNSIEVNLGEGSMSWTRARTVNYKMNRGALDEVTEGDDIPLEVTFSAQFLHYTANAVSGADPTPIDALWNEGAASAWVSSDSDTCRLPAVDLVLEYHPDCDPGTVKPWETITFPDFRIEGERGDVSMDDGTLEFSGKCNAVKPTAVREAYTSA